MKVGVIMMLPTNNCGLCESRLVSVGTDRLCDAAALGLRNMYSDENYDYQEHGISLLYSSITVVISLA